MNEISSNQNAANTTTVGHPLVSVIVPIFNAEPYLDQCLDSVRSQTYENLQIICLNDGSTDGSLQIIKRHAAADARIEIIDKRNEGYGASCNRGIKEARGKWLAIVEPDDWIEPTMYADMLDFADTLGEPCDIIKTPYWRIILPDTPQEIRLNCSFRRRINPKSQPFGIEQAPHLLRHHPSIWSALYRMEFIREKGIFFHEIPGAGWADNPFLIDTLCATKSIAYLDVPYYCYREETPEKSAATAVKTPLLPLERWNDMMDSIERLDVHDPSIIEEMYRRAFTYLSGITEHIGTTPQIEAAEKTMFARMDPEKLYASRIISPDSKQLYSDVTGTRCTYGDTGYWKIAMIGEFLYTLRNAGPKYTWHMIRKTLGR